MCLDVDNKKMMDPNMIYDPASQTFIRLSSDCIDCCSAYFEKQEDKFKGDGYNY